MGWRGVYMYDTKGERMEDARDARAFITQAEVERDEDALVEAARTNAYAFGVLYEQYYARVYRYIYLRLGNATDAEDVTAVVFMKALEGLGSYSRKRSAFAPWLFRIAHNAVIDTYRRSKKQYPLEFIEHRAGTEDPVADVLHGERREELLSLIGSLSPDQREVVLMRFAGDLSYPEIAEALKKNEAAVRMLLHRGLRKLKAVMGDD